jgi:hypothetical protein
MPTPVDTEICISLPSEHQIRWLNWPPLLCPSEGKIIRKYCFDCLETRLQQR